ncbi:MAG TPA: hybrid sensor histidine kinase/response regulator [Candidatus Methylacidiphilales bacterium]|nr:hybrid sensor histidine kinase/response regulator [Candidatus Methylacidiphilales bacterium]
MNPTYDYRQFSLLYVDDETQTSTNFKEYFSDTFDVHVATSGEEGWRIFSAHPARFAIVMTDQRMPDSSGVELLQKVRSSQPRVIRILATAYSDLDAAIQAVNTGAIYKYITKPWDPPTLEMTLKRGMEFFLVQRERDLLLHEKMFALQRLMMTDRLISLGIFAAGLNHHLRNSLTAVKTFLDLAPSKLKGEMLDIDHLRNPDYWHDFYRTVQEQIGKVVSVLQDIKEIPEPPTLPMADVISVSDLLREVAGTKAAAFANRKITVSVQADETLPIKGNSQMLRRALDFILQDEAINVNPEGKVCLSAASHTTSGGTAGVLVSISDNGPAIPSAALYSIFDPFFVRRNLPQEYGLNLLTAFFLIYHHGGEVVVKTSGTGGALFEIFLPQDPHQVPVQHDEDEFLKRVFATEKIWEKLLLQS